MTKDLPFQPEPDPREAELAAEVRAFGERLIASGLSPKAVEKMMRDQVKEMEDLNDPPMPRPPRNRPSP